MILARIYLKGIAGQQQQNGDDMPSMTGSSSGSKKDQLDLEKEFQFLLTGREGGSEVATTEESASLLKKAFPAAFKVRSTLIK